MIDIDVLNIVSLIFVSNALEYDPRSAYVSASVKGTKLPYTSLDYDELMQLSSKERAKIHDINVLRKLKLNDLTIQQRREVTQSNMKNFLDSPSKVKEVLDKVKERRRVFMFAIQKNLDFADEIESMGGEVTGKDVTNIVSQLTVRDYCYSTLSYLDWNWNSLLMVFEFKGEYTFPPIEQDGKSVTVTDLDIYIKIDVDTDTGKGYAALSFHNPEFKLTHPYENYPIDKE